MRLNAILLVLVNLFIISLLIELTDCKKKNSTVSSRGRSSRTEEDEVTYERSQSPGRGQGNKKKKVPPGHRKSGQLPPGLAKRQQISNIRDEEVVPTYDEEEIVNPPRNVNKPNRVNPNRDPAAVIPDRNINSNNNNYNSNNQNQNINPNSDYEYNGNNRPQTQRPPHSKPQPFPTSTEGTSSVLDIPQSEWRSLERLQHHWENTAHTRSELSKKFLFWLERDTDYQRYDACLTPDTKKLGHCHFVQHCPIPDVIRSFDKFLTYACFIRNRYVGICCPNDYLDPEEIQRQPVQSASQPLRQTATIGTTRRPVQQQRPPNRPATGHYNDGSDYDNGICGVSENTRIIGGALADPKDWLWMAALILRSESRPYCGGVLITNQHILTAAHCLAELTPDDVTVRLGAYDFSASADPEAQDFATEYFKIHPKYHRVTNENDLAIIKLRRKTRLTEAIKPICLPQKNRDYAGQLAIVTGWGKTSFGGRGSAQLRQVSLPVWNNTQCDASYSIAIHDTMLCAGNKQGGKDSCQGDSGGPLMLQGPNKRWMIIGVVSWGIKCGQPDYPGVYTRVSKYIDWIQQNSKDIY